MVGGPKCESTRNVVFIPRCGIEAATPRASVNISRPPALRPGRLDGIRCALLPAGGEGTRPRR